MSYKNNLKMSYDSVSFNSVKYKNNKNILKTKLSSLDKDILNEIYDELEKIYIPTTFARVGAHHHAVKTGTTSQRGARQTAFGLTNYQGKKNKSKSTIKYPHIMPLFEKFIKTHYPEFKFETVYVNKNTVSKKHLDCNNTGESLLVGFGYYTGGRTVIYDTRQDFVTDEVHNPEGNPKKFNIKTHSLIFNGSELLHESEKFNGIRYSLVFF